MDPSAPDSPFRVLVTDPLHDDGLQLLRDDPHIELLECLRPSAAQLQEMLPGIDAWIVRSGTRITADDLGSAPRLKVVARAGVGVDNIDVAEATRHGVLVVNAPDANAITTAELAIAHLLSLARHLVAGDRMVRAGGWQRKQLLGSEVSGKQLGVIGLGRIGRHVADRARGLGMKVLGHDPYVTEQALGKLDIELLDLADLFQRADFISLHAPLNDHTRGLLNAAAFSQMKPGVRIINCARGGLIVDEALTAALEQGKVAGAALDVFQQEPPDPDSPLLQRPEVVVTPHLGASTEEASSKVSVAVAEQVLRYLTEGRVGQSVNLPALAHLDEPIRPFLSLCTRAGMFLAQMIDWPVASLRAEFRGEVAEGPVDALTLAFLQGFLQPVLDRPVNLVNARLLAAERGMTVEESRSSKPRDFQSLLRFEADTSEGLRSVAAALFGRHLPRLVMLDQARLEILPEGELLVLRNHDVPGVIGKIGSLLGEQNVNIRMMHVSPPTEQGFCHAVLGVSHRVTDSMVEAISSYPEIQDVRRVSLP